MIWEHLARAYSRAPNDDEMVRLGREAADLWARASAEDLAWVARSLERLSDLDFLSSLLYHVTSAPRVLLEPLIAAAVRAPRGGTQFERIFVEYAAQFYGPIEADEALLRYVTRASAQEVRRSAEILAWWTDPTPAMWNRRQSIYAQRFLASADLDVERILVRVLRFDEAAHAGAERDTMRRALEKARSHPDAGIRAAAARQLDWLAVLGRMPAWMRPAWDTTRSARWEAAVAWPGHDPEAVAWITEALAYPEEHLHYFAVHALAGAPATTTWPEALRHALVGAAVDESNPSLDRLFVEPAVAFFGADAIANDLLDRMGSGDEEKTARAAHSFYWICGTTTPETKRRKARVHLTCFAAGSPRLRGHLAWLVGLREEDPSAEDYATRVGSRLAAALDQEEGALRRA